jgi:outer membrane immunogenic protein
MNKLLLGIGLAGLIGTSTMAADLRPPAAPVEFFTWTGGYVGVNLGAGWRQPVDFVTTTPSCTDVTTCLLLDPDTRLASTLGTGPGTRGNGLTGGFQVGYNYQAGPVVLGVEADWEYFKRSSQQSGAFPGTPFPATLGDVGAISVSNEVRSTWLATIRGRLGLAWDRLLVYATGGVAFTDLTYTQNITASSGVSPRLPLGDGFEIFSSTGGGTATNVVSQTKAGGTIGGGAEYALWNNLTVRAEYLYAQFSGVSGASILPGVRTVTVTANGIPIDRASTSVSNAFTGSSDTLRDHIVRIGLNYKFTYGGVVGSY